MINFEKLNVYQNAVKLALDIYKITVSFSKEEKFGIVDQVRRASVSISLNIAESSSRSKKDFCHFLDMARGSAYELVPLLTISLELKYINQQDCDDIYMRVDNISKRINALKKSIKS